MFVVGPESAGAHPGPVCYKKGGPLTVTDANLALGRLLPEYFPNIFGPNEDSPLDKEQTIEKFRELTGEINRFLKNQDLQKVYIHIYSKQPLSIYNFFLGRNVYRRGRHRFC